MTMNSKARDLAVISAEDIDRSFDPVATAEELRQRLAREPFKVIKDSFSKANHVPVSVLEWTMDWVFGPACWSLSETEFEDKGQIGSTADGKGRIGLVVIVKVKAIHPLLNFVTEQTGVASGDYTHGKFKMAFAAIQKLAFKNACKKWGKVFGRDLNRKVQEVLSDQWSQKQIIDTWKEQDIKDLVSLGKALRLAEKQYGKSKSLNDAYNIYKNNHIDNE